MARDVELSYLSHPGKKLTKHLRRIEAFADDGTFRRVARYHDVGKCLESFQRYIRHEIARAEPHAKVSAVAYLLANECLQDKAQEAFFGYCAVLCHHTALKSKATLCDDLFNAFEDYKWREIERQYKELYDESDVRGFWNVKEWDEGVPEEWAELFDDLKGDVDDYVTFKLLYSRLLFADKYEAVFGQTPQNRPLALSLESLEAYKRAKGFDPDSFRSRAAKEIVNNYRRTLERVVHITAPTGVGKTLASLELALEIAHRKKMHRIIYAIPFTSIIDQTVAIFSEIFPGEITPHHYRVDFSKFTDDEEEHNDYDRVKYLVQSWHKPFIVTTFYQLFFALFGDKNSDNVRFQGLHKSVVVIDEVQAIPFGLWKVMQEMFEALAERLDCVFVLMSATMPVVAPNAPELAKKEDLFASQNRYELRPLALQGENETVRLESLAEAIITQAQTGRSILCVVNTIKNAKRLYALLRTKGLDESLYCLNSYMLPENRQKVLKALREKGSNRVKGKVLVSTQVIEAGVDLDFDLGFRELAPLSSIIQSAGRVNREGKRDADKSSVWVFDTLGYEIYDAVLMSATRNELFAYLEKEGLLPEREILGFVEHFFAKLDETLSDRFRIKEAIERYDFEKLGRAVTEAFGGTDDFTESIAIGVDVSVLEAEYFTKAEALDKWALKSFKEQAYKGMVDKIVNIKKKDLQRCGANPSYSALFGLYYFPQAEGVYSQETGFLIEQERSDEDVFD